MGDAGEGLVDSDARAQERRDELEQARKEAREPDRRDPATDQLLESLRLTRADLSNQLAATVHERRRAALTQALAELDERIAAATAGARPKPPLT